MDWFLSLMPQWTATARLLVGVFLVLLLYSGYIRRQVWVNSIFRLAGYRRVASNRWTDYKEMGSSLIYVEVEASLRNEVKSREVRVTRDDDEPGLEFVWVDIRDRVPASRVSRNDTQVLRRAVSSHEELQSAMHKTRSFLRGESEDYQRFVEHVHALTGDWAKKPQKPQKPRAGAGSRSEEFFLPVRPFPA